MCSKWYWTQWPQEWVWEAIGLCPVEKHKRLQLLWHGRAAWRHQVSPAAGEDARLVRLGPCETKKKCSGRRESAAQSLILFIIIANDRNSNVFCSVFFYFLFSDCFLIPCLVTLKMCFYNARSCSSVFVCHVGLCCYRMVNAGAWAICHLDYGKQMCTKGTRRQQIFWSIDWGLTPQNNYH